MNEDAQNRSGEDGGHALIGAPRAPAQPLGGAGTALRDALRRSNRRPRLDHRSAHARRCFRRPLDRWALEQRHLLERASDVGRRRHRLLVGLEMDAPAMNALAPEGISASLIIEMLAAFAIGAGASMTHFGLLRKNVDVFFSTVRSCAQSPCSLDAWP